MGKIGVFNYVTVDGFFAGSYGETDWFYSIPKDKEFRKEVYSFCVPAGMVLSFSDF